MRVYGQGPSICFSTQSLFSWHVSPPQSSPSSFTHIASQSHTALNSITEPCYTQSQNIQSLSYIVLSSCNSIRSIRREHHPLHYSYGPSPHSSPHYHSPRHYDLRHSGYRHIGHTPQPPILLSSPHHSRHSSFNMTRPTVRHIVPESHRSIVPVVQFSSTFLTSTLFPSTYFPTQSFCIQSSLVAQPSSQLWTSHLDQQQQFTTPIAAAEQHQWDWLMETQKMTTVETI